MWKDWLERTLTRSGAPVMLASEILCVEPANGNETVLDPPTEPPQAAAPKLPEPAEAQ